MSVQSDQGLEPLAVPVGRRAPVQRALEIGISVAFLALALRGIRLEAFWAALRNANYVWLVPAVGVTVLVIAIKAWRWGLLFRPEYRLPFGSVFTALSAGYLASNVLPARLGELVSVVLLVSEQPVSVARSLSTVIVMRLLDTLTLVLILVGLLPFVQLPLEVVRSAQALGMVAMVAAAAMVLLSFWRARAIGWARAVLGRVPLLDRAGIYDALGHLIDGFATLRGRMGAVLIGVSLLCWVGVAAAAWFCGQAFHLDAPLTAIVFTVIVAGLGMVIPSTPGYFGVFHGLTVFALAMFGVPKELALSFAVVWHGANYLTLSSAGVIALWVHGTSLGQVLRRWGTRRTDNRTA